MVYGLLNMIFFFSVSMQQTVPSGDRAHRSVVPGLYACHDRNLILSHPVAQELVDRVRRVVPVVGALRKVAKQNSPDVFEHPPHTPSASRNMSMDGIFSSISSRNKIFPFVSAWKNVPIPLASTVMLPPMIVPCAFPSLITSYSFPSGFSNSISSPHMERAVQAVFRVRVVGANHIAVHHRSVGTSPDRRTG